MFADLGKFENVEKEITYCNCKACSRWDDVSHLIEMIYSGWWIKCWALGTFITMIQVCFSTSSAHHVFTTGRKEHNQQHEQERSKKLMPIIHTKMLNISFRNTFFFVSILILTYMCEVI